MPYIPAANRPAIDEKVQTLAGEIADEMIHQLHTAEISAHYRRAFAAIADFIAAKEHGTAGAPASAAQDLAEAIFDVARGGGRKGNSPFFADTKIGTVPVKGGWAGELNYAITRLIQRVPHEMHVRGAWDESFRYWIYAQTVGALTRTAYELHARTADDYVGNGLAGVLEDVKDEYKRRVNSAYEAAQILKSGDCYEYAPFRTKVVAANVDGVAGYQEVMLPKQTPAP